ncbi:hypothetical protein [Pseudonocardia sp. NPDC049635]|uniref:hypothetical protein n=1 Tax=Pseudonocardia sp. NPDC049635 TaxID=3155506 RepID=UPI0033EDED68
MSTVDHSPLVRSVDRDELEAARQDRLTLATENGALREEVEQLRARAETAEAEAEAARRDADSLTEQLTESRAALRGMARRASGRRHLHRATGRELSDLEDEVFAAWEAMPEEVRRAADSDRAGLPAAVATLVQCVERVLPGWFSTPAEARSRNERTARAEAQLRRIADEGRHDLAESCGLVLDELSLYRRLRTRGGPPPESTARWSNVDQGSPASAYLSPQEVRG